MYFPHGLAAVWESETTISWILFICFSYLMWFPKPQHPNTEQYSNLPSCKALKTNAILGASKNAWETEIPIQMVLFSLWLELCGVFLSLKLKLWTKLGRQHWVAFSVSSFSCLGSIFGVLSLLHMEFSWDTQGDFSDDFWQILPAVWSSLVTRSSCRLSFKSSDNLIFLSVGEDSGLEWGNPSEKETSLSWGFPNVFLWLVGLLLPDGI